MSLDLDVTDIFAGAGGSSTGMIAVPGVRIRIAANHSKLAVRVHNANHPDTDHACVDLHMEDPRNFPRTAILWASPECTKWSIANNKAKALSAQMGGDPSLFDDVPDELQSAGDDEATRSRLLMFDVLRFVEHHRYRAVFVENVVDVATQAKYRQAWEAWQRGLRKLGYAYRVVSLNSMHAQTVGLPAPQSRDRLYVVAWPEKERAPEIERALRPQAWCPFCSAVVESRQAWKNGRTVGRYRAQYVYCCGRCGATIEPGWLPAAAAIDWALPGKRIGDKPIRDFYDKAGNYLGSGPLAPKTMARIRAGIERYWRPFTLAAAGNTFERRPGVRTWPVDGTLPTFTTSLERALAVPLEGRDGKYAQPTWMPGRTQTTRHETALVIPAGGTWNDDARPASDPHRAFTTREAYSLLQPFVAELRGGSSDARPVADPLAAFCAGGNHHALVAPYYGSSDYAKPASEPIGTLTTVDRYALVMRNNTPRGDPGQMVTPVMEPMRSLTTTGHQSLISSGEHEVSDIAVEDCLFRMFEPHEVAAGMAFPHDYKWEGDRRQRVKLMGNAVTPPSARDLTSVVVESLGGAA